MSEPTAFCMMQRVEGERPMRIRRREFLATVVAGTAGVLMAGEPAVAAPLRPAEIDQFVANVRERLTAQTG